LRRIVVTRALLAAATVVACVVFAGSSPYFLSANNLINLLNDLALAGIVAIPATFLMMTGHVDLSVGATAALTGVVLAAWAPSLGLIGGLAVAVGAGLLVGAVNGALVTIGGVNNVAATFATMALGRGLAYLIPSGLAIVLLGFRTLGNTEPFWGIALPTFIFGGLAVLASVLSARTATGRRARTIGRIPRSRRLSLRSERGWVFVLYLISALAATLVGLIRTSQLGTGLPSAALGLELTVVTAVLLGGGHLAGGRGSVGGTLLALLLIYTINNGLSLANVTAYAGQVLIASLLVIALVIDGPLPRRGHDDPLAPSTGIR
jgi:ribose/xylose/arabinose/galactoside ABC-type transport system permease subunit